MRRSKTRYNIGDIVNWIDGLAIITDIKTVSTTGEDLHYVFYLFDTGETLSDFVKYMDNSRQVWLEA